MRVCKIAQHLNTQAKEVKVTVAGHRARREGGRSRMGWGGAKRVEEWVGKVEARGEGWAWWKELGLVERQGGGLLSPCCPLSGSWEAAGGRTARRWAGGTKAGWFQNRFPAEARWSRIAGT